MGIKTRLIKIGNSKGVRIPKSLLDQAQFQEEVELKVEEGRIIISPSRSPRQGWEEAFQRMAQNGDDRLMDDPLVPTTWDNEEWEW